MTSLKNQGSKKMKLTPQIQVLSYNNDKTDMRFFIKKNEFLSELNENNVILNKNPNSKKRKADLIEMSPIKDNLNIENLNESLNSSFFIDFPETKKEEMDDLSFLFLLNAIDDNNEKKVNQTTVNSKTCIIMFVIKS